MGSAGTGTGSGTGTGANDNDSRGANDNARETAARESKSRSAAEGCAAAERVSGEAAIIEGILAPLAAGFPGALGLRDDCAALTPVPGEDLVLKTDAIAEGIHFLPDDDPADIGWKALAVAVSDLAAKGARPSVYLMALSFPAAPRRDWLEGFAAGLAQAQAAFAIHLAGGDTDRRPGPMTATITAIGGVAAGRMVQRGTARPGDRLIVTGTLGDAALGLSLRLDPRRAAHLGLDAAQAAALVARYHRPQPRLALGPALLAHARAAMDLSDGLAKDLGRMCRASGCGADVAFERLPLSDPARVALAVDPGLVSAIVAGGDDYEILAAVPSQAVAAFLALAAEAGVPVAEIGACRAADGVAITSADGRPLSLEATGYDHF